MVETVGIRQVMWIVILESVIPLSEMMEPKLLYVCPGCSNHMYNNNMITGAMFDKTK
jgi:hypothetical protein